MIICKAYLLSGGDMAPGGPCCCCCCHFGLSSSLIRLPCDLDLISSGGPATNGGLPPNGSPPSTYRNSNNDFEEVWRTVKCDQILSSRFSSDIIKPSSIHKINDSNISIKLCTWTQKGDDQLTTRQLGWSLDNVCITRQGDGCWYQFNEKLSIQVVRHLIYMYVWDAILGLGKLESAVQWHQLWKYSIRYRQKPYIFMTAITKLLQTKGRRH